MTTTLLRPAMPSRLRPATPRRLISVLITALFGLGLAVSPMSATTASAAVSASVALRAMNVAAAQVGIPYRYGGASRSGFDCSGLTQYAYGRVGKKLPRTAQQQYNATIHIRWAARRPGDLVFFYSGNTIYHMGIYAGNWYMYVAAHTGTRVQKQRIWTTMVYFGRVR